ncbi:uncharacterized protein TRAVEDRAFT_52026 [Trametes versicolor FP-101664 SS1]|uniref:uncharacterized protein n=1 Tax=Trametes versicolor (strain FP-101664) TaxID=717944 RepID=UPI000462253A|nr:uncharacterized protein TRAVEDRAFT_52026 [Trametes versicolor FP-101664 SS1]EIW54318.1 hypothetical protein TRAVEDRAFT_52026 [Trametes versicolor FP-101664 SS1]
MAPDDAAQRIPLVDLWFELADRLTADTIPSPLEFYQERDAIIEIFKDARARLPHVPTPLRNDDGLSVITDDASDGSDFTDSSVESMPVQFVQDPTAASPQSDLVDWRGPTPASPAPPLRPYLRQPNLTEPLVISPVVIAHRTIADEFSFSYLTRGWAVSPCLQ